MITIEGRAVVLLVESVEVSGIRGISAIGRYLNKRYSYMQYYQPGGFESRIQVMSRVRETVEHAMRMDGATHFQYKVKDAKGAWVDGTQ